jgi:MFS family permease
MTTIANPGQSAPLAPKTGLGSNYAWLIVLACIGFYAIPVGVVGNTSGVFLTPVMKETGWDRTTASLYMTIQPWAAAVCTPFAAKIMARYNPRWVLTITAAVYGLATIWTAYATQPWEWHAYGVIYGICCAFFMFLAVPTLINAWFRKSAGLALGIAGAALSLIAAIFSPVAQAMITANGWRSARLVLGIIITVVPTVLAALFVRRDPASMGVQPYGAAAAAAEAKGAEPAVTAEGATLAQARSSVSFYLLILVAGFFVLCAAFFQQIPSFAATGPLGAAAGALAVSIVMVGAVIGKFLLGWMSDKFGTMITGIVAGACGAIGVLMAFLAGSNLAVFYIGMGVFGIGYSALTVVAPMLAREGFGTANYADIYQWVSTGIFIFSGAAALIYARIYDATKSFDAAFILVIVMYALTAVLVPFIVKNARKSWSRA